MEIDFITFVNLLLMRVALVSEPIVRKRALVRMGTRAGRRLFCMQSSHVSLQIELFVELFVAKVAFEQADRVA